MFGKKKKEKKQKIKTFIGGEKEGAVPVPIPSDPQQEMSYRGEETIEPRSQPEPQPKTQEFNGECIICFDFSWYLDATGVWHNCPRCNPKSLNNLPGKKQPVSSGEDPLDELVVDDKPTKGNLYEFRFCKKCQARNELHKKKKKWKCESCGVSQ